MLAALGREASAIRMGGLDVQSEPVTLASSAEPVQAVVPDSARLIEVEADVQAYEPGGCTRCGNSGYKGRIGLYEVMRLTEEIRQLAITRASADQVADVATRQGMRRLRDDGFEKVRQGLTSIAEVARVTGSG